MKTIKNKTFDGICIKDLTTSRQVLINAIMSVIQVIVISGVLFIFYKFLLNTIGVEQLGIWSLVLAMTSINSVANFGISGSVVKFVAKYIARKEKEKVSEVIQTATLSIGILTGIILFLGYPLIKLILSLVIPEGAFSLAATILPYSIFALWLLMISSIFQSGLDGYQRIYIRNLLLMVGIVFYLLLCFILVPIYGLMGLAYAQVIQNSIILLGGWFLLKRYLPFLPTFPYHWNKSLFKEMIGYGINFQIISVIAMFYDPVTKALLSKFGGLPMVGYYEMVNKMVQQLRAIIISANYVLVPAFANLQEKLPDKIKDVYLTSYQLVFYLALPMYSLIIAYAPIISEIWIGKYERIFILFTTLLASGWFLNTLNVPAYFANLGIGELRWNVIGHFAIVLVNAGLGFLLGTYFGGSGVVIAWVISLAIGCSIICSSYHIRHKIPLIELLPKSSKILFIVCLSGVISILIIQNKLNNIANAIILNSIIILSFLIVIFIPFWLHPMRKRMIGLVTNELLHRKPGI